MPEGSLHVAGDLGDHGLVKVRARDEGGWRGRGDRGGAGAGADVEEDGPHQRTGLLVHEAVGG